MSRLTRAVAAPPGEHLEPRLAAMDDKLDELRREVAGLVGRLAAHDADGSRAATPAAADPVVEARLRQAGFLARVDVREHNRHPRAARFSSGDCQAVSAEQCDDPAFLRWAARLQNWGDGEPPASRYHRKLWEWAYIAECADRAGVLAAGRRGLGFGVGTEPLPALFAAAGVDVLATDQPVDSGADWATTDELMRGLEGLARPHLIDTDTLARRVRLRHVDMNVLPDDLGTFDLIWSSCVIEHLGSPARGLDFVRASSRLLEPGGLAVHTTELELTARDTTVDYGHCAIYRPVDLVGLADDLRADGFECGVNLTVALESPLDRWVSLQALPGGDVLPDEAHLKLVLGDSVSTSFAIVVRRPAGDGELRHGQG